MDKLVEYQSSAVQPGECISKGWELIKNDYWLFFAMTLVAGIIIIAVSVVLSFIGNLIIMGISSGMGIATQNAGDMGKASGIIIPQLISLVIQVFQSIITTTLSGVLVCGLYSALVRKVTTGLLDFGDLFSQFQKITYCLIVAVVLSVLQFIIGVIFLLGGAVVGVSAVGLSGLLKNGQINPAALGSVFGVIIVAVILYILIMLMISVMTTFIYPLIAERNLSAGQAITLSIKSGLSNFVGIFLLLILTMLMMIAGAIPCGLGLPFLAPIVIASYFAAYQSVFGISQNNYNHTPPPPSSYGNNYGFGQ